MARNPFEAQGENALAQVCCTAIDVRTWGAAVLRPYKEAWVLVGGGAELYGF